MKCPKCNLVGSDVSFVVLDDTVFIKEHCTNGHYFGKTRFMTDIELKKFRPFSSLKDVIKKFELTTK